MIMNGLLAIVLLLIIFPFSSTLAQDEQLRQCRIDEFHYEYTECDSDGGRWRVAVPKVPGECRPNDPPGMPQRGRKCNFACDPGEFLDVQGDQKCHPCPPGSYSLGGGVRYDDWAKIPPKFSARTQHFQQNGWSGMSSHDKNCSRSSWSARGDYIMSLPSECPSSLLYSAKLVRAGQVLFEYQFTDPESIFHFTVQNDQCQAANSRKNDKWLDVTEEGEWKQVVIDLKSGMNVLQWKTLGGLSAMSKGATKPVLIKKIEITGVAYTSQCSKCPNGTYSAGGTSFCKICDPNMFSGHGDTTCTPCKDSEYSVPGAPECTVRPPCAEYDYFRYQKPCAEDGKTRMSYKWTEPKICSDIDPASVKLPPDGPPEDCPPCNMGMYHANFSFCKFCPAGQYADKNSTCRDCPASTAPSYSIDYKWWNDLPVNMSSHCISMGVSTCTKTARWLPVGNYLQTNFGAMDNIVFVVLIMKLPGFKGEPGAVDGKPAVIGKLTFELEIHCETGCQLLLLSDSIGHNVLLQMWDNTTPRKSYTHDILTNESFRITWAFQPHEMAFTSAGENVDHMKNYARMFSIKVTNTVAGGASGCDSCPEGTTSEGCIPCEDGHFMDPTSQKCKQCPKGTVLPSTNAWGKESCKACGSGLHAVKGRSCQSDCQYTDQLGRHYDFRELDGPRFVPGARLFAASGIKYYHGFNISLCSIGKHVMPTCYNNLTLDSLSENEPLNIKSMICRSTIVPDIDPNEQVVSTKPTSLGSHLSKIVSNASLEEMYIAEGYPTEGLENDIHFYYESGESSVACQNGRTSIISLRCDVNEEGMGTIQLPPMCADGTCDGCNFHFLWLSQHACPKCRKEDYSIVRGECIGGEQNIHYFPPVNCIQLPTSALTPMSQKCRVLPFVVMISIPIALGVGLLLLLLLVYLWSRNKKLEYKYMKLVETAGGQEGELPAAETCGMEDDEEDVHFRDERNTSFFGKIREKLSPSGSRDDDNPFVAVKMSSKSPLT